jgi:hypothetical protein
LLTPPPLPPGKSTPAPPAVGKGPPVLGGVREAIRSFGAGMDAKLREVQREAQAPSRFESNVGVVPEPSAGVPFSGTTAASGRQEEAGVRGVGGRSEAASRD